jgi:hypothetical protein
VKIAFLVSVLFLVGGGGMAEAQEPGIIARTYEDGFPLIFKLVDELPDERTPTRALRGSGPVNSSREAVDIL